MCMLTFYNWVVGLINKTIGPLYWEFHAFPLHCTLCVILYTIVYMLYDYTCNESLLTCIIQYLQIPLFSTQCVCYHLRVCITQHECNMPYNTPLSTNITFHLGLGHYDYTRVHAITNVLPNNVKLFWLVKFFTSDNYGKFLGFLPMHY